MSNYEIDDRSLTERIADRIEQLIKENEFLPEEKIPNERELAEKLGVGRGTIREAIKILVSRNVLKIKRGTGTFVCKNIGVVEDPLGLRFIRDKKRLALDLCQIRAMVEPQIAALTAKNATEKEISELQNLCDEVKKRIQNKENYTEKDIEFHTKLAKCTGNLVIPKIIPMITQGISLYTDITQHSRAGRAFVTHQAVVDAIRCHDSESAYRAMEEHLKDNRETIEML